MLILSRRINEVIKIGDDIEIVLVASTNKQAKIGISAPTEISVHRKEVYDRIQEE